MKVVGRYGEGVLETVPDEVGRLERLGYDALTTGELKNEATMRWTLAAHTSTRAEIGMSVMIAFPRSPFVTAQMAWELQRMTGGRISVGLGTQVKGHNERTVQHRSVDLTSGSNGRVRRHDAGRLADVPERKTCSV